MSIEFVLTQENLYIKKNKILHARKQLTYW